MRWIVFSQKMRKNRNQSATTMRADTLNNCQTNLGVISTILLFTRCPLLIGTSFEWNLLEHLIASRFRFSNFLSVFIQRLHYTMTTKKDVTCQPSSIRNAIIAIIESLCSQTLVSIHFSAWYCHSELSTDFRTLRLTNGNISSVSILFLNLAVFSLNRTIR